MSIVKDFNEMTVEELIAISDGMGKTFIIEDGHIVEIEG